MSLALLRSGQQQLVGNPTTFEEVIPMIEKDVIKDINGMVPLLREWVKDTLYRTVPVRTGKLLDTMLQTLHVEMYGDTLTISALIPAGYPSIIRNPAHSGQIGYGKKYSPVNPIPNRAVIRATKKGAYYVLNDPSAVGEYIAILGTYIFPIIRDTIPVFLSNYDVNITSPPEDKSRVLLAGDPSSVAVVMDMAKIISLGGPITSKTISEVFSRLSIFKWSMNQFDLRDLWDKAMAKRAVGQKYYKKWK